MARDLPWLHGAGAVRDAGPLPRRRPADHAAPRGCRGRCQAALRWLQASPRIDPYVLQVFFSVPGPMCLLESVCVHSLYFCPSRTLPGLLAALRDSTAAGRARSALEEALGGRGPASECWKVLERLPLVHMEVGSVSSEGSLEVLLERRAAPGQQQQHRQRAAAPRAYAPRYPKQKEEGWWLLAGDPTTKELMALRRVSLGEGRSTVKLQLPVENGAGEPLDEIEVALVSDSYLGLDQHHTLCVSGEGKPRQRQPRAQVIPARDVDAKEAKAAAPPKPRAATKAPRNDLGASELLSLINLGEPEAVELPGQAFKPQQGGGGDKEDDPGCRRPEQDGSDDELEGFW